MNNTAKICATLYKFRSPDGREIDVVRVTDKLLDDWADWPEQYKKTYPDIGFLETIAGVEFVDERSTRQ